MMRVSSEAIVIISSGTIEKRVPFLNEYLSEGYPNHKIVAVKMELSRLAQLINILRSDLRDKPLSHALKDREVLKNALMESNISL